jgi:hypothetical protein
VTRRCLSAALAVALIAVLAPGARAAWTAPQTATGDGIAASASVDVDAAGRLALAYTRRRGGRARVELRRGSLRSGLHGTPVPVDRDAHGPLTTSVRLDAANGQTLTAWEEGAPPASSAVLSRRDGTPLVPLGPFAAAVEPYAIRAPDGSLRLVLHGGSGLSVLRPRGARIDLPTAGRDARVAITPRGEVIAAWTDNGRLRTAAAPPEGPFGPPVPIPSTGSPSMPRLAAGPDGRVLTAWLDRTASGTGVQAVSRSPEGTLGSSIPLADASEDARAPSLVAAANGELLITYVDGRGVLRLRRMRPDGTPIGRAARISGSTERTNGAALAVTPSATQVVWSTGTSVRARRIGPGGVRGRVQILAPAGADDAEVPVAAGGSTGGTAAAWVTGGRVRIVRERG